LGFRFHINEENMTKVSTAELADHLDCTPRSVRAYAARGIVKSLGRGVYDLERSVRGVVKHYKRQIERNEKRGISDEASAATVKFKLLKVALLEQQYEREAATLIRKRTAHELWGRIEAGLNRLVTALPDKFAAAIPLTATDHAKITQLAEDGLHDLRLSDGYALGGEADVLGSPKLGSLNSRPADTEEGSDE
jgi:phage terminase Nu1 subunit (DNA packaging protein)